MKGSLLGLLLFVVVLTVVSFGLVGDVSPRVPGSVAHASMPPAEFRGIQVHTSSPATPSAPIRVALLVDNADYASLHDALVTYVTDVTSTMSIDVQVVSGDWAGAPELRAELARLYATSDIEGAILVGTLPSIQFTASYTANGDQAFDFDVYGW